MKRAAQVFCLAALIAALTSSASGQDFTVIALPDTQNYSQDYPQLYTAQTQWIVNNVANRNIKFVTHLGDIVNEAATISQWVNAKNSMNLLDNANVPYGTCVGNHDILYPGDYNDPAGTNYLAYFGPQYYAGKPWYLGASPSGLSNAQLIDVGGGLKLVFVHLLVETPAMELAWAQSILNKHRDKPTMISTHRYLFDWGPLGAGHYGDFNYVFEPLYRADGIKTKDFLNNFVRANKQIYSVWCGHNAGEHRQVTNNYAGLPIQEVLADYQDGYGMGGNGYLRIMTFKPSQNQIQVQTYSPSLNQNLNSGESEFVLGVDFDQYVTANPVVRLQNGLRGYNGTQDTWVNEDSKNSSYGNNAILVIDDDTANSFFSDYKGQAMIRWDGLTQGAVFEGDPAPTGVPAGSTILSANVTINLTDDTRVGNPEFYVYRMTKSWNESSTWNSMNNGLSAGDDFAAPLLATFYGDNNPDGDFGRTFSIKPAVEAWVSGSANYGIAIIPQSVSFNDDGIDVHSSEAADSVLRPVVQVEFTYNVINRPPIVTTALSANALTVNEGGQVVFTIAANDPNPLDPLTFVVNGQNVGFATGGGAIEYAPVFDDEGIYVFTAQVKDDEATVAAGTASIQVFNVAPTIETITPAQTVAPGESFNLAATAYDPGVLDVLTYQWDLDGDGQFDDFTGASGNWSFANPGSYTLTVVVSDGDGGMDFEQTTVLVESCAGDLDGDSDIDDSDLGVLLASFGCTGGGCGGDVDGDGDTDDSDLGVLLSAFGSSCGN